MRRPLRVGHQRRALGHLVADLPQVLDAVEVGLAEVVPDAGVARDDVGLIAAVGDDVVRALLQAQMLAAIVPAHVHQLDGIERRSAAPRRAGAVRRFALEGVLDRDQPVAAAVAPRRAQPGADVVVEHGVDVLEEAGAHVVGLGSELLFGDARPDHDRARQLLALHHPLHRDGGEDVERRAGVVPLAVAGRAVDDRIAIRDAWLLRRLRNAVDVRSERDRSGYPIRTSPPTPSGCRRCRSRW